MTARLAFALPGEWLAIDPRNEAASAGRVDAAVRDIVGAADDAALARRHLRDRLRAVVDAARASGAHGVFLCLEIAAGVRLPATLTVHAPSGMTMTPAVGTSAGWPDVIVAVTRMGRWSDSPCGRVRTRSIVNPVEVTKS